MKKNDVYKWIILLILFFGTLFVSKLASSKDIEIVDKQAALPKSDRFSLSMWIKPQDNRFYNNIFKISNNKTQLYLINFTEDSDYKTKGLTLSWNEGLLASSSDNSVYSEIWSNIVLLVDETRITLYLDGMKCLDGNLSNSLSDQEIFLTVFEEFEFKDIKHYNYILNNKEIQRNFSKDIDNKFENIVSTEKYPCEGGEFPLNNTPNDIKYSGNSSLTFNENSFVIPENESKNDICYDVDVSMVIGGTNYEKSIEIKQKGNNEENNHLKLKNRISNNLSYYMSTSNVIEKIEGINVNYKVIDGNAYFDSSKNKFIKNSSASERENITIQYTVSDGEKEETYKKDVVLLNDYVGYLLVFFDGEDGWPYYDNGNETLYFAYSNDLDNWTILNEKAIISCNEGTNRFRDPYIGRDKDGNFIITCTQGYSRPEIYITKTKDFTSFTTRIVNFSVYDSFLGLKGDKSWAPEYFYNDDTDSYTILFSEGNSENNGIYAVDTSDFINFSYPYLFLNKGYNCIDADMVIINGKNYLFYKDERSGEKKIYYAVNETFGDGVWKLYNNSLNKNTYMEGPFVLNTFNTNKNYLYLDAYKLQTIYSGILERSDDGLTVQLTGDKGLNNLNKRVRHFSIIPITENELVNIVNYCK